MVRLTAKTIDGIETRPTAYILFDAMVPGFGVRVLPTGIKTYVYRYKIGKLQRQASIGRVTAMRLDDARGMAMDLYAKVRKGDDPVGNQRAERGAMTLAALIEEFREKKWNKDKAVESKRAFDNAVKLHINPLLGNYPINYRTMHHKIDDVVTALRDRPAAANNVRKYLKLAFDYAMRKEYIDKNPATLVEKLKVKNRSAVMSTDEAIALWEACAEWATEQKAMRFKRWKLGYAIQLLIATGIRKGEAITLLRSEYVKPDKIHIPEGLTKTRAELIIPRTDLVNEILGKVMDGSTYVFWNGDEKPVYSGEWHVWPKILARARLNNHYRIHDIRHTFASIAGSETTLDLKQVGMLLNHARASTTERYVKYFDRTKEQAAEAMGEAMKGILQRQPTGKP